MTLAVPPAPTIPDLLKSRSSTGNVLFLLLTASLDLQSSGLSTWIGHQMLSLSSLPPWAVTLLACILVSIVTEFVSNPATITIFLPILCSLVSEQGSHMSEVAGLDQGAASTLSSCLWAFSQPSSLVFKPWFEKLFQIATVNK